MEKTIPAAFAVIGGAIVGAIVFWVIFYFAAAWLDPTGPFEPTFRATNFALTFGLGGGVFIGYEQARKVLKDEGAAAMALPVVLMLAAWLFGAYLLFFLNAWQVIFSGGFSSIVVVVLLYLVILGWISRALGGSFQPFNR